MSGRSPSAIAEEEAEPLAAVEDDEDDGEDVPEIDADVDGDDGSVIVRD